MVSGKLKLRREILNSLNDYVAHLKSDYEHSMADSLQEIKTQMISDFVNSLILKKDKQHSRVIVRGAIHSFIVMQDYSKFKRGDILKPRNRTTPDTDFVHGNVLEKKYEKISWSGI